MEFKITNWTDPDSKICPRMNSIRKGHYKNGYLSGGTSGYGVGIIILLDQWGIIKGDSQSYADFAVVDS